MQICVVGSGYLGLVAAASFAELAHEVVSVDNDIHKIELLHAGEVPIHEEFLPELLEEHRGRALTFSTDLQQAVCVRLWTVSSLRPVGRDRDHPEFGSGFGHQPQ